MKMNRYYQVAESKNKGLGTTLWHMQVFACEAGKALDDFVDDMSNWYVRRSRDRFWQKDMPQDKINAYMTLYTALVTVAKAAAPMIPFMSESSTLRTKFW